MSTYNGHRNWQYWNVSLWINNDYGLYMMAVDHRRNCSGTRTKAAQNMLAELHDSGITETPDGAKYTVPTIRAAIAEI